MAVIRADIRTDTNARDRFIAGVLLLKQERSGGEPSTYDSLVIMHHTAMHTMTPPGVATGRNAAHGGPVFLPWHRYYLLVLEGHIQRVLSDRSFGLPYWDWMADGVLPVEAQRHAAVWSDDCMGPLADPVVSGPFTQSAWPVTVEGRPNGTLATVNRGLRRRPAVSFALPIADDLSNAMAFDVYDREEWASTAVSFRNALEGRYPWRREGMLHNRIHRWVGLDMVWSTSPNDPVFFLHHANVDRIWTAWMVRHPTAGYVPDNSAPDALFRHRLDDDMHFPYLDRAPTPRAMLDVRHLYEYDRLV